MRKYFLQSITALLIVFSFASCKDNNAEIEKLKLQLELEKAKEENKNARIEAETKKLEAEKLRKEKEALQRKANLAKQEEERRTKEIKQNISSSARIVLKEIDDIAFVGVVSEDQIRSNYFSVSISTQYDRNNFSNGSVTDYIEDDIPFGVSYLSIGVYNWVWTGWGKGKYQYSISLDIDDENVLRQSSGGRVNDNTEGMKFFTVLKCKKDQNGRITVFRSNDNSINSRLKIGYSREMKTRNPG